MGVRSWDKQKSKQTARRKAGFFVALYAILKTKTDLLRKPLNFGALQNSLVQALKDTPVFCAFLRFSDFSSF
jgi:hypothetical protein